MTKEEFYKEVETVVKDCKGCEEVWCFADIIKDLAKEYYEDKEDETT